MPERGVTECAQAYLAEYGQMPRSRDEQDRYSAFRFGFEAGRKSGLRSAYITIANTLNERAADV